MSASDPITAVANVVNSIIDRFPTQEQKDAAKLQLAQLYLTGDLQRMATQAGVVTAEATSGNKLAASWRPVTMLVFVAIIANNYIVAPYLQAMFHVAVTLTIPPDMWDLLKLGIGGYVAGRSVEKAVGAYSASRTTTPTQATAVQNIFHGGS
ncbi:3TM-type holin [Burkholderia pseudomallei]|uniref:3TM-type holin n=1 Tax=Burkholderia pseudomallei TaxID=28450 RepID=UPI0006807833|nr:3TM-type holin [Burkholderia pseudomallei]